MPMRIYKEVIDGICDLALDVQMQISFGLFGDGLVDPLVVERSSYLRKNLPHVHLCINTNGAAFNNNKHADLVNYVDTICRHCESLDPRIYNYLMQPLRFSRVSNKYTEILDAFPGKMRVSVPVSRRNIDEIEYIRRWFLDRGAQDVVFDPLSRRCSEDSTLFNELALQPYKIACEPDILEDLIVDCDGLVLACCNDFSRQEPIGNFENCDLHAVLQDPRRREMRAKLANKGHDEIKTCTKCYGDLRSENFPFDTQAFSDIAANSTEPQRMGITACDD
jgi:hypothetical protein